MPNSLTIPGGHRIPERPLSPTEPQSSLPWGWERCDCGKAHPGSQIELCDGSSRNNEHSCCPSCAVTCESCGDKFCEECAYADISLCGDQNCLANAVRRLRGLGEIKYFGSAEVK